MPTLADLLDWDPAALDGVADDLVATRRTLTDLQDELDDSAAPGSWRGEASAAATTSLGALRSGLANAVAALSTGIRGVTEAAGSVAAARRAAEDAITLARGHAFQVDTGSGVVHDTACWDLGEGELADRARLLQEIVARLDGALAAAADADGDLAAALGTAAAGVDGGEGSLRLASLMGNAVGGGGIPARPPSDAAAADWAAWWASMSAAEQDQVTRERPDWIGNRDGIPAGARDAANRQRLADQLDADRGLVARLEERLGQAATWDEQVQILAATREAEERIEAMESIGGVLALPERQLLLLDPTSGEQFRAAVANGDLDTAAHVGVFTPGFTSTVTDSLRGYDDDLDLLRQRAEDESLRYGDGGSVATVTWMGYDAPQWGGVLDPFGDSVASSDRAEEGGRLLRDFLHGIDASRMDDPQLTALGHSYGSTTTGYALQEESGVDRAVVFGSPGLGTTTLDDIDVPDGEFYRVEASRDAVADLAAFGIDPTHVNDVVGLSAQESEVDGQTLAESTGHSAYLRDDTTSQHNLAVILGGADADRLVADDGRGFGDWLTWTPDFLE